MTLAVCARTLQGQNGDTLGGAEVTVRVNATGDLADIFADRDGNTPAPNPITASATGTVEFYVTPGVYRLEAIGAGGEETQVVDLGGVSVIPVATIADLKALDTAPLPDGQQVSVAENGSTYLLDEAAGEWTRSDLDDRLGTAATADVTQSPTDTTAGRLLKVGDEGPTVLNGFGTAATEDDSRYVNVTDAQTIAGIKTFTGTVDVAELLVDGSPVGGGGLGVDQDWQDVSGSRTHSTSYQNTTGRPIEVAIRGRSSINAARTVQISSDDATWIDLFSIPSDGSNAIAGATFTVPDGWYYRVSGALQNNSWAELR